MLTLKGCRRVCGLVALVPAFLTVAACGLSTAQRSAVAEFAGASATGGDFIVAELPHMRDAAMDLNASSVVLRGRADSAKLDDHFPLEVITVRVAAGQALASYGRLLQVLVEDTQHDQLVKASNHFVTSFKNVGGKSLSDGQYEALGTAVQVIGGLIVEHKKKEAIKRIVPQVKPDIDTLCDLFIADFSVSGLNLGQALSDDVDGVKADVSIALADRQASFTDRSLAVQAQVLADREGARAQQNSAHAKETFTRLKQANAQLANVLENETASIDDIRGLAKQVQAWADTLRALSAK